MMPVFHPAAARELSAAVQNGEDYSRGLGAELKAETQRVTQLLLNTPLIGEPGGLRGGAAEPACPRSPVAAGCQAPQETDGRMSFTPDQQPIQRTVGKRKSREGQQLTGPELTAARAAMTRNARYRTRTPKGLFYYSSHEEMAADRLRWTVDLMVELNQGRKP